MELIVNQKVAFFFLFRQKFETVTIWPPGSKITSIVSSVGQFTGIAFLTQTLLTVSVFLHAGLFLW